jgi:hypothetical protein
MIMSDIVTHHFFDVNGNPAGGTTFGRGFAIGWQNGPLGRGVDRKESNGAFVEDVIEAAADRLAYYQGSTFASDHNARALDALRMALKALNVRNHCRA